MEDEKYYISSTKCSLQERQTKKHGKVYDVYFTIIDTVTMEERQKKLSGFSSKAAGKAAHADFITKYCSLIQGKKKKALKEQLEQKALPSLSELINEYIRAVGNSNKDATLYEKEALYKRFLLDTLGDIDLSELTQQDIYNWQEKLWITKNERTGKYYSYAYLNKIRALVNSFFVWVESKYTVPNLLENVKKPRMSADQKAQKKEMLFWEEWEFKQFIEVVDDPMYRTLFITLFYTGRRIGEVFAMRPEDILWDKQKIRFNSSITRKTKESNYKVTSTKTGKKQTVDVSPKVLKALKEYGGEDPFFFSGEHPLSDNTVRRHFYAYIEKAGVKQIRLHDLRHSFVTLCIHHLANLKVVAELIGDTLEQVTKTYAHLYSSDARNVVQNL